MLVQTHNRNLEFPYEVLWIKPGFSVKVNLEDFPEISKYNWWAKRSFHCWYAVRWTRINGKRKLIRMHRVIAKTPDGMFTHHLNFNTMDNRRNNLLNVSEHDHAKMFSYR